MTKKEAENIAYRLVIIHESADNTSGVDVSVIVAQTAIDSIEAILSENPKIKSAYDSWEDAIDLS